MKILLTGGSGFLGAALARRWGRAGHTLLLPLRPDSNLRRLQPLPGNVAVVRCASPHDMAAVATAQRPDVVVHTACAYGRQGESPLAVYEANVHLGTLLLDAVLHAADTGRVQFLNTGTVLAPELSLYALSKQQFSAWGLQLAAAHPKRVGFVDVGLQHMYGPHDDASKFTTHVIQACRHNQPELLLTAGEQRRDFIFVDDVVDAYDLLVQQRAVLGATERVELGSGHAPTLREFVERVHALAHSRTHLRFGALQYRAGEPMCCRADISMLQALGWAPRHDLDAGLRRTFELESLE